jgi:formylglycine-generating enzyme required for sulfatase activity
MSSFSKFADELHCRYCHKPNPAQKWPLHGDLVPFYTQDKPATPRGSEAVEYRQVEMVCPFCERRWYVVWDQYPEDMKRIDRAWDADAMVKRGVEKSRTGDLAGAIEQLELAVGSDPEDFEARRCLGVLYAKAGQTAAAIVQLEAATRLDAFVPQAHHNLGVLYRKQGRNADAVRCFEAALRLEPDYAPARQALPQWRPPVGATPVHCTVVTNSIGMRMALIPAGEFLMGSPDSDHLASGSEKPQHRVRITRPFYLGIYPVTQAEYKRVTRATPSHFKRDPNRPVDGVSWDDAQEFCRKLSALRKEKATGRLYRLPTEAEWEYACRAGSTTRWCFGDYEGRLGESAWFDGNSGKETHAVGQKKPNAWGLYDMHGNVWEWCEDGWWYTYADSATDDPHGSEKSTERVCRGGGWNTKAGHCRSANRNAEDRKTRCHKFVHEYSGTYPKPVDYTYDLGFRVAMTVVEAGTGSSAHRPQKKPWWQFW